MTETLVTVRSSWSAIDGRVVRWFISRSSLMDWMCVYCGGEATHMDHVLPRSRGGGALGNLAPACARCNLSKNNRTPEQWIAAMYYRIKRGTAPGWYQAVAWRLMCPMGPALHAYRYFFADEMVA